MNRQQVWVETQMRNFKATPNGVRWEAVIFSSEFNRNKSYFDIQKMAKWSKKLTKIQFNNNHNSKSYFSIGTDQITDLKIETDDNGITEVFAVVESSNSEKIANPEMVTGFSIEILVDAKDIISNENGEYYINFEWIGVAYLTGELAGSGDSRLLSMRTFAQAVEAQSQPINNINLMSELQATTLIEQITQLNSNFSSLTEKLEKQIAYHTVMPESDVKEVESVEAVEVETAAPESIEITTNQAEVVPQAIVDEAAAQEEAELIRIDQSINKVQSMQVNMAKLRTDELVTDRFDSVKTTDTKEAVQKFLSNFKR